MPKQIKHTEIKQRDVEIHLKITRVLRRAAWSVTVPVPVPVPVPAPRVPHGHTGPAEIPALAGPAWPVLLPASPAGHSHTRGDLPPAGDRGVLQTPRAGMEMVPRSSPGAVALLGADLHFLPGRPGTGLCQLWEGTPAAAGTVAQDARLQGLLAPEHGLGQ